TGRPEYRDICLVITVEVTADRKRDADPAGYFNRRRTQHARRVIGPDDKVVRRAVGQVVDLIRANLADVDVLGIDARLIAEVKAIPRDVRIGRDIPGQRQSGRVRGARKGQDEQA